MSEALSPRFRVSTTRPSEGVAVLALEGELDFGDAGALDRMLRAAFADGSRAVLLDLSGLAFVDSSGINTLVGAARLAGRQGTQFGVSAPTEHVRQVFAILRIADVLPVDETIDAALQRIG